MAAPRIRPKSPSRAGRVRALPARAAAPFGLETLEPRELFFAWTPQEVYFAELINRARANPQAESQRLGINFSTGLTLGEQALLVPQQPLVLNQSLTNAARAHSADMAARDFFDHVNPDALTPTDRAQAAGYQGTAGENIGGGYASIDDLYEDWMRMPDERRNALSLYTSFDSTFHYDQIGPGFVFGVTGAAYPSYSTTDFGNPTPETRSAYLLGVVFSDNDHDNFYSVGEGAGGIRIDVFTGSSATGTPLTMYTTDAAGNYQLPLPDGNYTVVFTRADDNFSVTRSATVAGKNVELSAKTSEFAAPPPGDDHPDAGDWARADPIAIDPETGNGATSGALGTSGDTDLFVFVASQTGTIHITGSPVNGAFNARIRVYNDSQSLLITGLPGSPSSDSGADVTVVAGSTYYLLVQSINSGGTGNYTITIDGPTAPSMPPIDGDYLSTGDAPSNPTFFGGNPVVGFVNPSGHAVVARRSTAGVWTSTDLQQATGAPNVTGDVQTWVEQRDGFLYAAAASSAGVLVFKRDNAGNWTYRNLTAEIHVSTPIISNLTSFVDGGGLRQIAGLNAAGHVVTYWMTGLLWPQGWRYFYTDIATRDLVRRNHIMPDVGGTITSYVTHKNSLNVIATTSGGSVILFFRPGGGLATQLWNWANLTQLTHCAPIVGNVTAQETSGRIVNISGADADGNLWMITWRSGEGWTSHNATQAATGNVLVPGSVTSWINSAGAGFVAGLTDAGDLVLYRYTFTGGHNVWTYASISAAVSNPPHLVGALRASVTPAGAILISGQDEDGQVTRFTFTPGQTWAAESVSEMLAW